MFRWVHFIDSIASLVRKICKSICSVFSCSDHKEDNIYE